MLRLSSRGNVFTILWNGSVCGTAEVYENPCHTQNRYLKLDLQPERVSFGRELFEALFQTVRRPLQVMVDSEDRKLCAFLIGAGCQCRRKCFEVEAAAEDYIGPQRGAPLRYARKGDAEYARCRERLYGHYCETHRAVNPWTAGREAFWEELPEEVFYTLKEGVLAALAFVEENEIAYAAARSEAELEELAASLIADRLEEYGTVCFESDDCDWAMMRLRAMFQNQSEASFNTYVYSTGR